MLVSFAYLLSPGSTVLWTDSFLKSLSEYLSLNIGYSAASGACCWNYFYWKEKNQNQMYSAVSALSKFAHGACSSWQFTRLVHLNVQQSAKLNYRIGLVLI